MVRGFADLIFICAFLVVFMDGCCPSSSSTSSGQADSSKSTSLKAERKPSSFPQGAVAVASRFGNDIKGTILGIQLIDSLQYKLTLRVDSVFAQEDIPVIAEARQEITARPQFSQGEGGSINPSEERNRRLLSLRSAKEGDTFHGVIALSSTTKEWYLLNVLPK